MRVIIDIESSPCDAVDIEINADGLKEANERQLYYGTAIRDLIWAALPALAASCGGKVVHSNDPKNS